MGNRGFEKVTFSAPCVDLTFEGFGVTRNGKDVVFVPGMFPGDEGDVQIEYRRAGQLYGKLVRLSKKSPDRIDSRCPVCSICGGCVFQKYAYEAELRYKTNKVKEQFRKVAHMDVDVLPCLGMEHPEFYRNKIQMPLGKDRKGNIYSGFYKAGTHVIVPIERCYIEDQRAEKILLEAKRLMKSMRIDPYVEDERYGIVRHLLIRTSKHFPEIMVVLVTNVDSFPSRGNFVKALVEACPEITTVVQNVNSRQTNVILGEKERVLYGKGYIRDTLCGVSFRISAKSFFQVNPVQTEVLYQKAMEAAHLSKTDIVFDAYSGIGTIGLIAAKDCGKVISVEIVKEAVADGKRNAAQNGITNYEMYCDDASAFMNRMAKDKRPVDVLFMDPPRKGSDERFLNAAIKLAPKHIVYISCDPSTLARDVAYLSKSYNVESVQPVDMFPRSFHVETVVRLTLRNPGLN